MEIFFVIYEQLSAWFVRFCSRPQVAGAAIAGLPAVETLRVYGPNHRLLNRGNIVRKKTILQIGILWIRLCAWHGTLILATFFPEHWKS